MKASIRPGKLRSRTRNPNESCSAIFTAIIFFVAFLVVFSLLLIPDSSIQGGYSLGSSIVERPSIKFVIFVGIEGTGHHFWQDLVKESPIFYELNSYGLHPEFTRRLTGNLYSHKTSRWKGLWSSPCKWDESDPTPNTTAIYGELVATLEAMKARVDNENERRETANKVVITFPVNFLSIGDDFGVASYPGFLKPCRPLQYPNLDLWYEACIEAKVSCQHVYIYRDPYAVIRSTTDYRRINKDKLEAIHLYTTQLHILYTQLAIFPDRLAGCWDFDEAQSPLMQSNEIKELLRFEDDDVLRGTIQKLYRPRQQLTESDKRNIVPAEFAVHMKSLIGIHERVVNLCIQQRRIVI